MTIYKREITVDNTSGGAETDFQVKVALTSGNFDFTKTQTDGSDVRVYSDSGLTTPISYWIQSWNNGAETATIWIEVPSVPSASSTSVWMSYGEVRATAQDIQATFLTGEDWSTMPVAVTFSDNNCVPHDSFKIGSTIYLAGRDGDQDMVLHKSTDGGLTWSESFSTIWSLSSGNQHCTADTDGSTNIYAATINGSGNPVFKLSTNSGTSWGSEVAITTGLSGANDPKILYVSSSILLIFIKTDGAGTTDNIVCYKSTDQGSNWSSLSTVVSESATSGIEDLDAILDADGDVRVCWENETTDLGASALKEAVSTDDGATWGSATTIVAVSGSIDNEGPHYFEDGANNLSIIYPTTAGTSGDSYDDNQIYQATFNGTSWASPSVIWESKWHVESVGEYNSDGDLVLASKRNHGDSSSNENLTVAILPTAGYDDFSDRGWSQDDGIAWVEADPADSSNRVARVGGRTAATLQNGYISHNHSGGDYVIEGRFRNQGSSANLRFGFGGTDEDNHYLVIFSSNVLFYKNVSGSYSLIATGSPSLAASTGTWYAFKIQMSGSSPTTVKMWVDSGSTASTLRINTTDSTYSSGEVALIQSAGATTRIPTLFDTLFVRKFAANEPTQTVGAESEVSAATRRVMLVC